MAPQVRELFTILSQMLKKYKNIERFINNRMFFCCDLHRSNLPSQQILFRDVLTPLSRPLLKYSVLNRADSAPCPPDLNMSGWCDSFSSLYILVKIKNIWTHIYWSLFGSVFFDCVIQVGGAITGVLRRRCRVTDGGVGGLLVFFIHSGTCVAVSVGVIVWFSRGVWGKAGGDVNSFHCSSRAGLVAVLLYLLVGSLLEGQSRKEEEDNHSAAFPAASTTGATLVMEGISCFWSRDIMSI